MVEHVPELAYHQYHNFGVSQNGILKRSIIGRRLKLWIFGSIQNKERKTNRICFRVKFSSKKELGKCRPSISRCFRQSRWLPGSRLWFTLQRRPCKHNRCKIIFHEKWKNDKKRYDKAGIPESNQIFQTKPQKALSIIKSNVKLGVKFDWIGGDGLYGHNAELTHGLDKEGLFYVLDVHKDELIYLKEPTFSVPQRKGKRAKYQQNWKLTNLLLG